MSIHFHGYADFVARRQERPIGVNHAPVPVAELKPNSWKGSWSLRGSFPVARIRLNDDSDAFIKRANTQTLEGETELHGVPCETFHLRSRGASILNDALQFRVFPTNELVVLQDTTGLPRGLEPGLYIISDWVEGEPLTQEEGFLADLYVNQMDDPASLIELFVFAFIAYNTDVSYQNLIWNDGEKRFYLIDPALTGNTPTNRRLEFPQFYTTSVEGMPIPNATREKLKHFIAMRSAISHALRPYYADEVVNAMFARARWLVERAHMPTEHELNRFETPG